jgi:hypothetical protein
MSRQVARIPGGFDHDHLQVERAKVLFDKVNQMASDP